MRLLDFAAFYALVVTTGALCHDGDYAPKLYDKNKAYQAARDACHEFQGAWGEQEHSRSKCQVDNGKGYDLTVSRRKSGKISLDVTECYNMFSREVHGCERGGNREYETWTYDLRATEKCLKVSG